MFNWFFFSSIISGLAIFLYGIFNIGDDLKSIFDNRLKGILHWITNKPWRAFLAGIILSIIIHSSSATIAIAISFACADLISHRQAINILLGANIGTTISGMLVVMDFTILIPFLLLLGVICLFFTSAKAKKMGQLFFHFGLIFLGLELLGAPLSGLANLESFNSLVKSFSTTPPLAFLVGILVTGVIQSSTAFIGILQKLFSTYQTIPVAAITALLLGSNIGTTFDGFLASSNKKGLKIALFNLYFNIIGSFIFLLGLPIYTSIIQYLIIVLNLNIGMSIVLIHFLFNAITGIGALIIINYRKDQMVISSTKI